MPQENIPLTPKGLPDEDKIVEEITAQLPADQQAAIERMRALAAQRTTAGEIVITEQMRRDAAAHDLNMRKQLGDDF